MHGGTVARSGSGAEREASGAVSRVEVGEAGHATDGAGRRGRGRVGAQPGRVRWEVSRPATGRAGIVTGAGEGGGPLGMDARRSSTSFREAVPKGVTSVR